MYIYIYIHSTLYQANLRSIGEFFFLIYLLPFSVKPRSFSIDRFATPSRNTFSQSVKLSDITVLILNNVCH